MTTILVIEDGAAVRQMYSTALKRAGHDVLEAEGGDEGLALAASEHPDAIVLDLVMPDTSGWDVIRRLRADAKTAEIPVLAISAESHESIDGDDAYILGCNRFLKKPIKLGVLIGEVAELVRH